jgi:predicted nucleic acid-binding protein
MAQYSSYCTIYRPLSIWFQNRLPRTGDDNVILACALAAGVEILVSGDRQHVLPLGEYQGVRIITAQTLLAELAGA